MYATFFHLYRMVDQKSPFHDHFFRLLNLCLGFEGQGSHRGKNLDVFCSILLLCRVQVSPHCCGLALSKVLVILVKQSCLRERKASSHTQSWRHATSLYWPTRSKWFQSSRCKLHQYSKPYPQTSDFSLAWVPLGIYSQRWFSSLYSYQMKTIRRSSD